MVSFCIRFVVILTEKNDEKEISKCGEDDDYKRLSVKCESLMVEKERMIN